MRVPGRRTAGEAVVRGCVQRAYACAGACLCGMGGEGRVQPHPTLLHSRLSAWVRSAAKKVKQSTDMREDATRIYVENDVARANAEMEASVLRDSM